MESITAAEDAKGRGEKKERKPAVKGRADGDKGLDIYQIQEARRGVEKERG